ncbi:MAG: hypothetical protein ACYS8Z_19590 [Planctomycetota bacterium]
MFVDQFDQEFSRDIEPTKASHADNYYYQLVANIRKYKGAPPLPKPSAPKTIRISGPFSQWQGVKPEYRDHHGEIIPRDHPGVGKTHYKNTTGRNDLTLMKVARDKNFIYFYARCRKEITSPKDPYWMTLLIDSDQNIKTGWQGYDYVINRSTLSASRAIIEKYKTGFTWQKTAEIHYRLAGKELHFAVPRSAIGLASEGTPLQFDFKWIDNCPTEDIMNFYTTGDAAPEGRFKYRYNTKSSVK